MCSDGHDEVCYEDNLCPVCEIKEEMRNETQALEKEIKELKDELNTCMDEAYLADRELQEMKNFMDFAECPKWIAKKAVERLLPDEET